MKRLASGVKRAIGVPLIGGALLLAGTAMAVHINIFELGDGTTNAGTADILGDVGQTGPDWADIFPLGAPHEPPLPGEIVLSGGIAATFAQDDLAAKGATDRTTFASSNKNNDAINTWQWQTGNTPGKDDFNAGYVWATIDSGDFIIYGGMERIVVDGDSHVDIEFNQDLIALDKDPECEDDGTGGAGDGPPCEFIGAKTIGDLLVAMDFEKGGDFGTIRIYTWDGTQFNEIDDLTGEGCNGTDTICGFNNGVDIDGGPWPNFGKGGALVTDIAPNGFTEFGINVTAELEANGINASVCFASVNFKSRTSQSINSELKDFSLHPFQECSATMTTQVKLESNGTVIADDGTPPTVGVAPLGSDLRDYATIVGTAGVPPTGTVVFSFFENGTCASTASATYNVSLPGNTDNPTVNTPIVTVNLPGSYSFSASWSGDTNYQNGASSGCEAFSVAKQNVVVTTMIVKGSTTSMTAIQNTAQDIGTEIWDRALVFGSITNVDPTGTVDFKRYPNASCSTTDMPATESNVSLDLGTANDGMSSAVSSKHTLSEGFICYSVEYSGDSNYNPTSSTVGEPLCAFDFLTQPTP
jgi:hypothetical protein